MNGATLAMASLALILGSACQGSAPAPAAAPGPAGPAAASRAPTGPAPARWLEVFTAFEGARVLCNQNVLGSPTARPMVEIAFTLYATRTPPADVVRFYATAHGLTVEPGATTVTVKLADGRKHLTVSKATDVHATCGVEPQPDEPTVIEVSQLISG